MTLGSIGGFGLVIAATIAANLMLKAGAMLPASSRVVLGVLSWQSVAGLVLFGMGGLIYAILLRRVPLNVAQVFAATQFMGVILAARIVLNEPISAVRWMGIACTCVEVAIVGLTTRD